MNKPMTKQEQIEEMALELEHHTCMSHFQAEIASRMLHQLGYRKPTEGVWEFDRDNALNGREPFRCSICNGTSQHRRPYCSLCGAKMKEVISDGKM